MLDDWLKLSVHYHIYPFAGLVRMEGRMIGESESHNITALFEKKIQLSEGNNLKRKLRFN